MSTWRYTCTRCQYLWPLSKVTHISLIWNSFGPEAIVQAEVNLHIEPSWDKGIQIYRNRWGHMTKMDAISLYGKNFWKSSSPELNIRLSWNLVYIGYSSTTKLLQMMILGWLFNFLHKGQFWFRMHLYGKMLKWWITQKLFKSIKYKTLCECHIVYREIGQDHFWPFSRTKVIQNETGSQVSDTGPLIFWLRLALVWSMIISGTWLCISYHYRQEIVSQMYC